jgi:multidrug resistance protein
MASYSLMQFIFAPIWGELSDHYGRKPIILIGLFGFAINFFLFGLSTNLLMLFASRIGGGILSSACLPTAMAYVADVTDEKQRGQGMGLMGAAMGLGIIIGPAIGGVLSAHHFSTPFIFAAIIALVNFVFAAVMLEEPTRKAHNIPLEYNRFRHIVSLRGLMAFMFFLAFLSSFSITNFEGTFSLFAKDQVGFGSLEMGFVFIAMGIVLVITQGLFVGKMIKSMGEENVIKIGLIISTFGYFLTIYSTNLFTLILFVSLASIGQGLCRPSVASFISKNTSFGEGVTMGAMQSVDSLGRIIGPVFGGFMYSFHYALPYLSGSAINLLFWIVFLLI